MTKLTKQEIEKERVKFEKWYKAKYEYAYDFGALVKDDNNDYKELCVDRQFNGWLARAELAKGGE